MAVQSIRAGARSVLSREQFNELIPELRRRGYQVIGPRVRDGAIVFDHIEDPTGLPAGWGAEQGPGRYRLRRRDDDACFGYTNTAQGLKQFLHPPELCLFTAERTNGAFHILNQPASPPRYAFLGVRACDLAALQRLDRILRDDRYADAEYQARRAGSFIIAVACTECASTCFCSSMGTGPEPVSGYDISLTECLHGREHYFRAVAGTPSGADVLAALEAGGARFVPAEDTGPPPPPRQARRIELAGLREAITENFESPRWEQTASRCLACGNCTMSCPTCFCVTVEDTSDVTQQHAARWRRWDSCFTQSFSYIHGGSVRLSPKSRYRQWLQHKLSTWVDQFGTFGCVGCGRCITWCPAGIDITEEAAALRG